VEGLSKAKMEFDNIDLSDMAHDVLVSTMIKCIKEVGAEPNKTSLRKYISNLFNEGRISEEQARRATIYLHSLKI